MTKAMSQPPAITYVVTLYNKAAFLPLVAAALAREGGSFSRDYIFVDDGSTDHTVSVLRAHSGGLPGPVQIIEQENSGASAATNVGVLAAHSPWIRLVDGDDLVTRGSSAALLAAAAESGLGFAYGDLGEYDPAAADPPTGVSFGASEPLRAFAGLARFIRNCPANSSSILVRRDLYLAAGGCDETLVSPDQMLFLRLFAKADGVHLPGPVALIPKDAPGRLSGQVRRSRYESVLALQTLLAEEPALPTGLKRQAYRRALARANTYARMFGHRSLTSRHFWRYLASKVWMPADPAAAIGDALGAFTEDGGTARPESWQPGALRRGAARRRIA
jgi:glycosyltransferase involved in cell wall biosynthesis